jgi:MoaA/NifB/PqqE/SkfB family radical SAM enzyme
MKVTNTGLGILGSRLLRRPFYARVHVTYRCNYRCQMCNVPSGEAEFQEMDVSAFAAAAERLWDIGARHVVLTGGEPFLRRDLPDIVRAFSGRGFSVRVQTNGGPQLSRERLAAVAAAGLQDLSVSVDTLDAGLQDRICGGRDVLHHALRTLGLSRDLLPRGMSLANIVASPLNFAELPDLVRHFGDRGIYTYITPVVVSDPGSGQAGEYLFRSEHEGFGFGRIPPAERDAVIDQLVRLRRDGCGLTNSTRYLEEFRIFVASGSARWACSAGELALDVRPDGRVSICKEKPPLASVLSPSFPKDFRSGEVARLAAEQRQRCAGCFYGEYREPHYAVRDARVLLEWVRDWSRTFRKGMGWQRAERRPSGSLFPDTGQDER